MNARLKCTLLISTLLLIAWSGSTTAQGSKADYDRASKLNQQFRGKVTQTRLESDWVYDYDAFPRMVVSAVWYRTSPAENSRWLSFDMKTKKTGPAFDHEQLAERLAAATNKRVNPDRMPLKNVNANTRVMRFEAFGSRWEYQLGNGFLSKGSLVFGNGGRPRSSHPRSRDGKWQVDIKGHNVLVRALGEDRKPTDATPIQLSTDGYAADGYTTEIFWSPDSTKVVVMKRAVGSSRRVTIIDSAPDDQLQPKTESYFYLKPGDQVPIDRPVLFDLESREVIPLSHGLAPNPYKIDGVRWRLDSSAFTYEYNQRGHQAYRVIEVDAETGRSRAVISEEPDTFFTYSSKKFLYYLEEANEMIWMSERDGWNHLYLYNWKTGEVKRQLTTGEWVVREVDRVDQRLRKVWFWAGGIHPNQDPYHLHYCCVDLDTGEVTPLTSSDGNHTAASLSAGRDLLIATWSRIDHPPVHELRNAETGELIKELARADASALIEAGWIAPELFAAKGRDGQTDIYGIIMKPTNFDPSKTYPVIENIYAGPHDAHVPKRFYGMTRSMALAELGFIVVRIDGMGTNWRSKAFHDVAWKNLGDAGFPDRMAWMEAAAQTRPWMDLTRVGIYGGSAGGQNAMRAVLDHHDFYKAAVADCGCHDNRMDKIWWNEQWMGWPVDESYEKSSNLVDAHMLGGKLLLTVGELDRNVDPASTMQVVDALIKADKDFELMVFTGKGHGAGESAYGVRLRNDFFVRHLHGKAPRWE